MPPVTAALHFPPSFIPVWTDHRLLIDVVVKREIELGNISAVGGHFITPRNYCCVCPLQPVTIFKSRTTEIEKLNFLVVTNEDEERRGGINVGVESVHSRRKEIQRRDQEKWWEGHRMLISYAEQTVRIIFIHYTI